MDFGFRVFTSLHFTLINSALRHVTSWLLARHVVATVLMSPSGSRSAARTSFQDGLRSFPVAAIAGQVSGALAALVDRVPWRARLQQRPHRLGVAPRRCAHERAGAVAPFLMRRVGARLEEPPHLPCSQD